MTSYKYWCITGIILMLCVCTVFAAAAATSSMPDPLGAAMQSAGAHAEELSINGWAKLAALPAGDAELEKMAVTAIKGLGVREESIRITSNQTRYQKIVRAEVIENYFHAVAIAEALQPATKSDQAGIYLVLTVETKLDGDNAAGRWQEKIVEIIKNFGGRPRISSCLVGWLDGKLGEEEWTTRLQNGFDAVHASMIDRGTYGNFVSYTGYTPLISDYIEVSGKRMNFNMAMRYSPYDHRTYVTIGSPVITREY